MRSDQNPDSHPRIEGTLRGAKLLGAGGRRPAPAYLRAERPTAEGRRDDVPQPLIDATNMSKSDLNGSALKSRSKADLKNDPSRSTARRDRLDERV